MMAGSRRKRVVVACGGVAVLLVGAVVARSFVARRGAGASASPKGAATGDVALASDRSGTQVASGGKAKAKEGDEKSTAVPVSVAAIVRGSVSAYITSTANLVPEKEVKVLAEAEGRVAELHVEEGRRVERGDVLASLAHEDAEIALRKAELKANEAKRVFERSENLLHDNLVSREAYDKIVLANEVTRQELAEAERSLEKTRIRAPFTGKVTERDIKPGQHVRPGDVLFTVANFEPLVARIYLPEKDVLGLQEGREVRITLKADERARFRGRIRQISPVVDTSTGTVKVTVEAAAPPAEVRPGAFVTIDIVREVHPDAVLLPRESIIRELQDSFVFVARGEVAEKRTVSLGLEEGGRIEVLSGVAPGEQVIVAGQGGLKHGSSIKIIPSREASDLGAPADRPASG